MPCAAHRLGRVPRRRLYRRRQLSGRPGPRILERGQPLNRTQLYDLLWWRQRLFDDKLIVRVGKVVPTFDFNNVVRPLSPRDESLAIPAV